PARYAAEIAVEPAPVVGMDEVVDRRPDHLLTRSPEGAREVRVHTEPGPTQGCMPDPDRRLLERHVVERLHVRALAMLRLPQRLERLLELPRLAPERGEHGD